MDDTRYLFECDRIWSVRIAVPRTLREALIYDLRRSLHTESLAKVRQSRDAIVAEPGREITAGDVVLKEDNAYPVYDGKLMQGMIDLLRKDF